MGIGFLESVYEKCLEFELKNETKAKDSKLTDLQDLHPVHPVKKIHT